MPNRFINDKETAMANRAHARPWRASCGSSSRRGRGDGLTQQRGGAPGRSGGSHSRRYRKTSSSDGASLSSRKRLGFRQAQQAQRAAT